MYRRLLFLSILSLFVVSTEVFAQKISLSTNIMDYANLGTLNLSFSGAVGKCVTLGVTAKCNPWDFNKGTDNRFCEKQWVASLDCRYWPWHVYSGWWILFKGQFAQYNVSGLWMRDASEEGYAYGGGLGTGYSFILGKHWNIDLGASFWAGAKDYRRYDCRECGNLVSQGWKGFISPSELFVSFFFIF